MMDKCVKAVLWLFVILIFVAAFSVSLTKGAEAQESHFVCDMDGECVSVHPPQHEQIHDIFYQDWMRLDMGTSCCNKNDCYPTIMIPERLRDGAGRLIIDELTDDPKTRWWALRQDPMREIESLHRNGQNPVIPKLGAEGMWVEVPEHLLEHNSERVDLPGLKFPRSSRPSPDGRSHACISGGHVLCAVVGEGI